HGGRGRRAARERPVGEQRAARNRDRTPAGIARGARSHPRSRGRAARAARDGPGRDAAQVTRVAAIDLGTNATRLLVADVADGAVDELLRQTRITRLGEGVDARRRLLPLPIARVRNVLADYRREAERLGAERVLAVA